MSDVEEPPTKMSKYEEYLDPEGEECLEEGQEEWLSEGVLTDDDYVHTAEQDQSQDKSETTLPPNEESQEGTPSFEEKDTVQTTTVIGQVELHDGSITHATITHGTIAHSNIAQGNGNGAQNIEEQLNNLESTQNGEELHDDLNAFLIRKTDSEVVDTKVSENSQSVKTEQQEDDGNDTDDLLRMLGEGDQKVKKKSFKVMKSEKMDDPGSSDDDEYIYERSQVKTLKLAKNALIKRAATKAVPEDMSDGDDETDHSSDEGNTVKRMFEVKKPPSSAKKPEPKKLIKHVVQVNSSMNRSQKSDQKLSTSKVSYTNKSISKSISKPATQPISHQSHTQKPKPKPEVEIKTPTPFKPLDKTTSREKVAKSEAKVGKATSKDEFDDLLDDEEEFLDEDVSDLDEEEFGEDSEGEDRTRKQRIMRPEMMDEEVPSDAESRSEDGSLYDELPSSDSDDLDDWFTLDVRAERAGDYLPLLGTKARELLLAERRRVSTKVATLRQSLSALTESARRQADQLRSAAMALAEIDDTLRAA